MKIVVVGAGIIGVTSAVELAELGHSVTLIDKNEDICLEASDKNAGHLLSKPLSKFTLPTRIHFPVILEQNFWKFLYKYITEPAVHISPFWNKTIIDSKQYCRNLIQKHTSIQLMLKTKITGFSVKEKRVTQLETENGTINTDAVVICAGIGSSRLLDSLGVGNRYPLLSVRGYSLTVSEIPDDAGATIKTDGHLHATVFENKTRVCGFADVGSPHQPGRCTELQKYALRMFPNLNWKKATCWSAVRPLTPNFVPYIGRVKPFLNLWINTGHGFWGVQRSQWSACMLSTYF